MKIHLPRTKPSFSVDSPTLCTFRSSKAYLWGLIYQRLCDSSNTSSSSHRVLDAACHALITRRMFPDSYQYYGLDISVSRLQKAFALKHKNDNLFHADLCKPLCLDSCFEVVVSCNTLSHLPHSQQLLALNHLSSSCVSGGSLYINSNTNSQIPLFTQFLLSNFSSLEVVYFDSYRSFRDEEASLINSSNIKDKLVSNEFNVPNDACFHSQVLFIAHGFKSSSPRKLPPSSTSKIIRLNSVPNVECVNFKSDSEILSSKYPSSSSIFLLTSKLFNSHAGESIRLALNPLVSTVSSLDDFNLTEFNPRFSVCILGLEAEWTANIASDRILVNNIRELPGISLSLLVVTNRDNSTCTPSLICSDV